MSKDLKSLNLKSIKLIPLIAKYSKKYSKHTPFILLIVVLLTYVYVVARISALSKADPAANQAPDTSTLIPRVNQKAIDQIQALENNNPQIHNSFEQARNNPFAE